MEVELIIKNFRCFSDEKPARLCLTSGFTAFLGINNSGKSALLRFFGEFRKVWNTISDPLQLRDLLNGGKTYFHSDWVADAQEVLTKFNSRDLQIE